MPRYRPLFELMFGCQPREASPGSARLGFQKGGLRAASWLPIFTVQGHRRAHSIHSRACWAGFWVPGPWSLPVRFITELAAWAVLFAFIILAFVVRWWPT